MADKPTRRYRRLLQAVLVGLGLIAVAGAVLWLLLPTVATRLALARLADMGVPNPRLEVLQIGYDRAVILGLAAGTDDELTVDEIAVAYHYRDILGGAVESVTLRGATLRASIGPDGLSLGSLDALLAGHGGGGQIPALPPIELEGARIDLATGFGAVALTGGGTLRSSEGGLAAELELAAAASQGSARGRLDLEIAGGAVDARLDLADSRVELPGLLTAAATGAVRTRLAAGEIAALHGELEIGALALDDPRAAALGPLAGGMSITRDAEAWRAEAGLRDAADSLDLALRLSTPQLDLGAMALVALDLDATADAPVWPLLGLPGPNGGRASIGLVARAAPAALIAALDDGRLPELTGSVDVDFDGVAYAGMVRSAAATAGFDIEMGGDTLRLSAAAPILGDVTIDRALLDEAGLAADATEILAQPLTATIELDGPLELRREAGRSTITGTPSLVVDLAGGHRLLDASGTARLDFASAEPPALQVSSLATRIDLPAESGFPPVTVSLAGSASATEGGVAAQLAVTASGASVAVNGLRATELTLDLPVALEYGAGRMVARLTGKGALSAARVTGTAPLALDGPVQLPFIPGDVPVLAMDLSDPEAPRGAVDLNAGPLRLAGTVEAERGPVIAEMALPRLVLHGELGALGWSGKLTASDGRLGIPTYDIEATDLDLTAELPAGQARSLAVRAAVAHRAERPVFVPLSASLDARQVTGGWAFTGSAADAFDRLSIEIEGRHEPARNRGNAALKVAPIEFAPNVRQPADLAPFTAGLAEEVSGTVALAGDITWTARGIASGLQLMLRNLSATTDVATISRLNGVITVDDLSPFTTPPGQRVAVAGLDVGLPLTDGLLTFRVAPGPKLEIAGGQLRLAGGTVDLEPLLFDPAGDSTAAVLAVTGVQLGELMALAGIDGLTGEGRMSGRIPVVVRGRDVIISKGELAAEASGWLSYAPLEPPAALQGQGETVSLALSALTNFHYQALRMTVDRQADGEMVVAMHVRGNNPDFYDGYPVEFNLNVSGQLDRVLRQGLAGYRIPEAIEKQLEEFAR